MPVKLPEREGASFPHVGFRETPQAFEHNSAFAYINRFTRIFWNWQTFGTGSVAQKLPYNSGVLECRGLGRQASLMWFNILGFWVVGFTTGWALTFKAGLGLSGIWLGIWLGILSGVTTTGMPFALLLKGPLHHVPVMCVC